MPRRARKKSKSGVYHIMLRGIDRQHIFEDEEDKERLWETLREYKGKSGYEIYGYCFMDNHVHLLMKFDSEDIGQSLKRIAVSYAYYFNTKYKRTGHLFQDRFRSEAVENDAYLLSVLRYIHRNPVVEGMCKNPEDFIWSSYRDYMRSEKIHGLLTDTKLVMGMIGMKEFKRYTDNPEDDKTRMLEPEKPREMLTDADVKQLLKRYSGCSNSYDFRELPKSERDDVIKKLQDSNAGFNQICCVTGWSRTAVKRALTG